jgi:hypothetical protein
MPAKDKTIEEGIRKRFLEVVDQLNADESLNIEKIMLSIGDYAQSYTQMKTGKRYPTIKNIVLLCEVYGVNANWLLFNAGSNGLDAARSPLERLKVLEQEIENLKRILST